MPLVYMNIIPELVFTVGPNTDFNVDLGMGQQTHEPTCFFRKSEQSPPLNWVNFCREKKSESGHLKTNSVCFITAAIESKKEGTDNIFH